MKCVKFNTNFPSVIHKMDFIHVHADVKSIVVYVRVLSSVSQGLPEFHFQPKMLSELGSQLLTASNYKG